MNSEAQKLKEFREKYSKYNIETDAKLLLFGKWLSMCYSSDELNGSNSEWWIETLNYFKKTVLPNFIKNKSFESHVKFLKEKNYAESR